VPSSGRTALAFPTALYSMGIAGGAQEAKNLWKGFWWTNGCCCATVTAVFLGECDMLFNSLIRKSVSHARKAIVFVVGGTVLLVGIVMLVGPGPGIVVIPIGLGILSIEFAWARRLLKSARRYVAKAAEGVSTGRKTSGSDGGGAAKSSKGSKS
jgi:uncharacterized protein (TIGR02611 family)